MADDKTPPADVSAAAALPRTALVAMVLISATLAATVPVLPLWLDHLGVHDYGELATYSALAFGGGVVASMLATPLWGALGDRTSHRAMIIRACVGLAVAQALMAFATDPMQVVGIRVLQGLVSGVEPALYAWVVARPSAKKSGSAIGRLESASTVGALIGPLAMTAVIVVDDISTLFLAAACAAVLAAVVVMVMFPATVRDQPREHGPLLRELADAARGPGVRRLLGAVLAVIALDAVAELLYPLLVVAYVDPGMERVVLLGAIEIAGEGAYLLAAPLLGALIDRRGSAVVVGPCMLISGLATAAAPWVPLPWVWVGLVAVGDGASSGVRAGLYAEVSSRGHAHQRGTVMSLVGSANRAGATVASAAVPTLVVGLGLAAAMTTTGLVAAILGSAWWLARPRSAPTPESGDGRSDGPTD